MDAADDPLLMDEASRDNLEILYKRYRKNLNLSAAEIERCLDLSEQDYTKTVPHKIIEQLKEEKRLNGSLLSLPFPSTSNPIAALTNFCRHQLSFDLDFKFGEEPADNSSRRFLHTVGIVDDNNNEIIKGLTCKHRKKDHAKEEAAIECLKALNTMEGYDIISYYIEKKAKIPEESRAICEELPATDPADHGFSDKRSHILTSYSMIESTLALSQQNDTELKEEQTFLYKAKLGSK
mgnify:CR=1 FL=1